MRKLFKNTKSNFFAVILMAMTFTTSAFAISPIAMVSNVKGNVFVHHHGKTKKLKTGDNLHNFSEIFSEVGSQITFSDYYDHQYNLAGSGHLKLNGKTIELKGGYLWLQSFNKEEPFIVETANAKVSYMYGESVISFDSYDGKSQIMAISGQWKFANKFEEYKATQLQDGQFSFITKDYEDGSPRRPTPIGQGSFKKVTSLFGGVKRLNQQPSRNFELVNHKKTAKRTIASHVESTDRKSLINEIANGGKEISPTKDEKDTMLKYYKNKVSELKAKPKRKVQKYNVTKKSDVKISIFGLRHEKTKTVKTASESSDIRIYDQKRFDAAQKVKEVKIVKIPVKKRAVSNRAPASVPQAVGTSKDAFESTLRREYKKQTRHPSEVNDLINELESFDQDFKRSY